jgi:hypothetical protein
MSLGYAYEHNFEFLGKIMDEGKIAYFAFNDGKLLPQKPPFKFTMLGMA